jgi:singapore isolate B (sub-type 7) whole genome shotgun sequence assembly, scaffold_27
MKEALQEIVHHRIHGRDVDCQEEVPKSTITPYSTIDDSEHTGKYAALFTFTSNRYHYTPLKCTASVTSASENYEDSLLWEDVRRSGLVFWNRNRTVFSHLALRIAMVGIPR